MDRHTMSTLPVRQPKRKRIFAIRLTDGERAEVEALAKQLKLGNLDSNQDMRNQNPLFCH